MPHARRARRSFLFLAAITASSAAPGCLRSSPVRSLSADIPVPAAASPLAPAEIDVPASLPHDDSVSRTSSPATDPAHARALPPPLMLPPPPPIDPPASVSPDPVRQPAPTQIDPPAKAPATPLIDAAIQRAEAIQRFQIETLASEPEHDEHDQKPPLPALAAAVSHPKPRTVALPASQPPSEPKTVKAPKPSPVPTSTQSPAVTSLVRGPLRRDTTLIAYQPSTGPELQPIVPFPSLARMSPADKSAASMGALSSHAPGSPKPTADKPLEIAEFRLCRHISGFGAFDVLPDNALASGQRILIYCEMNGLHYEPTGDAFLSKISSRLELLNDTDHQTVWQQDLGSAEESCRRIRRDYYVNCCIEFPATLPPGQYHLRLIVTDQIGKRTSSAQLPITLRP